MNQTVFLITFTIRISQVTIIMLIVRFLLNYSCNIFLRKELMTVRAIRRGAIYRYDVLVYLQPVTKYRVEVSTQLSLKFFHNTSEYSNSGQRNRYTHYTLPSMSKITQKSREEKTYSTSISKVLIILAIIIIQRRTRINSKSFFRLIKNIIVNNTLLFRLEQWKAIIVLNESLDYQIVSYRSARLYFRFIDCLFIHDYTFIYS